MTSNDETNIISGDAFGATHVTIGTGTLDGLPKDYPDHLREDALELQRLTRDRSGVRTETGKSYSMDSAGNVTREGETVVYVGSIAQQEAPAAVLGYSRHGIALGVSDVQPTDVVRLSINGKPMEMEVETAQRMGFLGHVSAPTAAPQVPAPVQQRQAPAVAPEQQPEEGRLMEAETLAWAENIQRVAGSTATEAFVEMVDGREVSAGTLTQMASLFGAEPQAAKAAIEHAFNAYAEEAIQSVIKRDFSGSQLAHEAVADMLRFAQSKDAPGTVRAAFRDAASQHWHTGSTGGYAAVISAFKAHAGKKG